MIVPAEVSFAEPDGCKTCHLRYVRNPGGSCPTRAAFGIMKDCANELVAKGVELKRTTPVAVYEDTENQVEGIPYLQDMAGLCLNNTQSDFDIPAVTVTRDLAGRLTAHVAELRIVPRPLYV